jgi:hypothetical protein
LVKVFCFFFSKKKCFLAAMKTLLFVFLLSACATAPGTRVASAPVIPNSPAQKIILPDGHTYNCTTNGAGICVQP